MDNLCEDITTLDLSDGSRVVVWDDKFTREVLAKMRWYKLSDEHVYCKVNKRTKYIHQLIYEHYYGPVEKGKEIDHIDRNPINNVPWNLRQVTKAINRLNTDLREDNKTGYKCVGERVFNDSKGYTYYNYRMRVNKDGKNVAQKLFPYTPEGLILAAKAANDAYRKFYPGEQIPNPEVE